MIKWSDYEQGGVVFEAFLPSDETEPQEWLLRASRNGVLLTERRISLVWVPRFGPDVSDVAQLEEALDDMLIELSAGVLAAKADGRKVTIEPLHPIADANFPENAALAHIALTEYAKTLQTLQLPPPLFRAFARLPPTPALGALLPMTVSVEMRNHMLAVIAVGGFIQGLPEPERAAYVTRLQGAMSTNVLANVLTIKEELVARRAT
ncbi:MAG: hypothetical protein ACTHK2_11220 [Dokdonella sp.]|uniref:hypothetical protein n=1 Tax=Dokdonella sp. TaxID=2291710 RepID=UPI003F7D5195